MEAPIPKSFLHHRETPRLEKAILQSNIEKRERSNPPKILYRRETSRLGEAILNSNIELHPKLVNRKIQYYRIHSRIQQDVEREKNRADSLIPLYSWKMCVHLAAPPPHIVKLLIHLIMRIFVVIWIYNSY